MVRDDLGFEPELSALTEFGGELFFLAGRDNPFEGLRIWRSDGTAVGTVSVADGLSVDCADERFVFLKQGNTLLFPASDATSGCEIWGLVPK